jgi:hypothetical protein
MPTSCLSPTVKAAGHVPQSQSMSLRKVQLAASPKGRVLLALWNRGVKELTTTEIKQATGDWAKGDVDSFASLIPAWLLAATQRTNAPRKSVKLGLSGAYDWSNPSIHDDVLIGKVLEIHKFGDVAQLCFYYGVPKVKRMFKQCEFGQMTRATVTRMLGNISKGLSATQADEASDRPRRQVDFLKSSPKLEIGEEGFDVVGLDELLTKKSIVLYDRVRSQDIFELMILTRDHGYTLKDIFAAIDAYQPIRHKDPEHFKSVVTGLIPVDENDEGFSSIRLNVKMEEIYKHFKILINDYEVMAVQQLRLLEKNQGRESV